MKPPSDALPTLRSKSRIPLDEVVDVIEMPQFDVGSADAEISDNNSKMYLL